MGDSSILGNTQAVVDDSGRVTLKNVGSSGIDFEYITDALVQAKRQPAIKLEKDIDSNNAIISDFAALNTATKSMRTSLESLRGANSAFVDNVFDQRGGTVQTFASASAPADHVPSSSTDLVSIGVDPGSAEGAHTVEILQKATSHQIRGDAISSKYDDLSSLVPPIAAGSFTINGTTIEVNNTDSLYDVAEKINNANTGSTPTGVSATIVSASDTEHYLVLSSDNTGIDNAMVIDVVPGSEAESATLLTALGLATVDAGYNVTIKNETVTPQNAIIDVNGLGINIERQSNTIDDVINGITLDIITAEPGTIIEIDISTDLSSVKEGIVGFVDAYNEMIGLVKDQQSSKVREFDENGDPLDVDPTFGNLAFDATFRQFSQEINQMLNFSNFNLEDGFQSLSQMGIKVNKEGILEIDHQTLDERLTDNVKEVEKFFSFSLDSSDPNITFISNGNNTMSNYDSEGNIIPYYLSIEGTDADGNITGASLRTGPGESDYLDGSVEINGNVLTFTDKTGAESLKIIYNGGINMGEVTDIEITPTRGIADSFYYAQNAYTKTTSGLFDQKIISLDKRNEDLTSDISKIDVRVEKYEKTIRAKFLKTEQAMSLAEAMLKQIEQQFKAMNKSD